MHDCASPIDPDIVILSSEKVFRSKTFTQTARDRRLGVFDEQLQGALVSVTSLPTASGRESLESR